MFPLLVLLFTVIPAVELILLIKVGAVIGAVNTLGVILFTGILGAYLARLQGFVVLAKIQENMNKGVMPSSELIDGVLILIGGIVLLTPGFITDTIGFLLLIPFTRDIIKFFLKAHFQHSIQTRNTVYYQETPGQEYDDIDIT